MTGSILEHVLLMSGQKIFTQQPSSSITVCWTLLSEAFEELGSRGTDGSLSRERVCKCLISEAMCRDLRSIQSEWHFLKLIRVDVQMPIIVAAVSLPVGRRVAV